MFRRKFIERLTLASATGLAAVQYGSGGDTQTVKFRVKGFTCITCAVGLDTLLSRQAGVVQSESNYSDATTRVEFKPAVITKQSLMDAIAGMGFHVVDVVCT